MNIVKVGGLILLALVLTLFAVIGVLYLTRGTPVHSVRTMGDKDGPPAVGDPLFRRTVELLAGVTLLRGNEIEVLTNGTATYPRLLEDLRSARETITLQMYYCQPGELADSLKKVLSERARAGVKVLFLQDAFGSSSLSDEYQDSLRAAGVRVAMFRPPHWYKIDKAGHRSHIRVAIADGRVGYTGGFGIADKWLGDARNESEWRDTNVRFKGPAVMQLQASFAAGWAEATGELLTGDVFFPREEFAADGEQYAALLHTAPTTGSTPAERFLALSLAGARKTMYITNPYFVPDDDFRRMLTDAARRGVDVRVLTPDEHNDVKITRLASRGGYEQLLEGGVRIYEFQPTMIHAKTFVIDGLWSSVGTMNFDNRSLAFNDESNLVAIDERLGRTLEAIFLDDLKRAKEIDLETFRRRPWHQKIRERMAHGFSRLL